MSRKKPKVMKFGNWRVDKYGIVWDGKSAGRLPEEYDIHRGSLIEARGNVYACLVHMAWKTWTTREDIYALNTAFLYAMERFKIPFPESLSVVETLQEQDWILKNRSTRGITPDKEILDEFMAELKEKVNRKRAKR